MWKCTIIFHIYEPKSSQPQLLIHMYKSGLRSKLKQGYVIALR